MHPLDPRDRLIVALDLPDVERAQTIVTELGDTVSFYKIGLELAYAGGLVLAERLAKDGKRVFLDLKLHDIPNTVARATAAVARLGATFLTIHAYPQTLKAARQGLDSSAGRTPMRLLAVTVLTSCDDSDLAEAGFAFGVNDLVARRAAQAKAAGIDGLVLSASEVPAIRATLGPDLVLVTPGIRPRGTTVADQKRVTTPKGAIAAGADYLVVGRPVIEALDRRSAAEAIVAEIAAAAR
jgi:orotidine-5'-phosphate decarboxylase